MQERKGLHAFFFTACQAADSRVTSISALADQGVRTQDPVPWIGDPQWDLFP